MVVFGQEFPDEAAGAVVQIFSLAIGAVGLAAFALVIALTEQVPPICPFAGASQHAKPLTMSYSEDLTIFLPHSWLRWDTGIASQAV